MSTNTFAEALELAYEECWRQGDYLAGIEKGDIKFASGDEGLERVHNDYWRETLGAQKVLAVLLNARGEIGRRGRPDDPDHFLPCPQQTWIRLMQWGVRKGLAPQSVIDEAVQNYPQYTRAMENLGKDVEGTDFRDLAEKKGSR